MGLGELSGGALADTAFGVSGDGAVVVGAAVDGSETEAFRWTLTGGLIGLGDLEGGNLESVGVTLANGADATRSNCGTQSSFKVYFKVWLWRSVGIRRWGFVGISLQE